MCLARTSSQYSRTLYELDNSDINIEERPYLANFDLNLQAIRWFTKILNQGSIFKQRVLLARCPLRADNEFLLK